MLKPMRKILVVFMFLAVYTASAQQEAQYSQYMQNNFIVNPAEGGTEEFIDLKMSYRTQWVGLEGAPKTFYVSGHSPVNKHTSRFDDVKQLPFHGVGGYISSDQIGPQTITSFYGSYAYHLPVSAHNDFVISFGMFIGAKQYTLDRDKIQFYSDIENSKFGTNTTDNALVSSQSKFMPDATAGIWGYSNHYYFGISTFQLFGNKVDFYDGEGQQEEGNLARHYVATAGYKFDLDADTNWVLVPSFVVKGVIGAPIQFDINTKLRFKDKYWLGVSYRHKDAIAAMAGITAKDLLDISYSYDFNTSNLNGFNTGTHEIMVGLRFPYHEHNVAPSQFW